MRIGKGHLVREIDALDGIIARAADAAAIHYRMLNRSKGSAVWGPRVQADRQLFHAAVQNAVHTQESLELIAGEVAALRLDGGRVTGIELADGGVLESPAVILCTGTFLGDAIPRKRFVGGRIDEGAAHRLARQLRGPTTDGLKTGTPRGWMPDDQLGMRSSLRIMKTGR